MYLISQAKTGLSALALKRYLGVSYPTAWLVQHKLMQAMVDREACSFLSGKVEADTMPISVASSAAAPLGGTPRTRCRSWSRCRPMRQATHCVPN
jgi:hypothetical protein